MSKLEDGVGKRFGMLLVKDIVREAGKKPKYRCICDCGGEITTQYTNLYIGKVKSCGCLLRENKAKIARGEIKIPHYIKHGLYGHRLNRIWNSMKTRCNYTKSANYKNYGGRGIKVCEEWCNKGMGFINFYNWAIANGYEEHVREYGEKNTTIDRIDVNGNYEPSNCKWSTLLEQAKNKRPITTQRRKGYHFHKKNPMISTEQLLVLKKLHLGQNTIREMIKAGMTFDEALKVRLDALGRANEYITALKLVQKEKI